MINFVLGLEDAQGNAKANKIVWQQPGVLDRICGYCSMTGNESL